MTARKDDVVGVVLAAGRGERLWPVTRHLPKALCPVGNVTLVDHGIARCLALVGDDPGRVAVNVHHGRAALLDHLGGRVHVSLEDPVALGTAGAIGRLGPWIDGRDVIVTNADAWLQTAGVTVPDAAPDLGGFLTDWDRERPRLLCVRDPARGDFGGLRFAGVSALPGAVARNLPVEPSGLYERVWRQAWQAGALELVTFDGTFVDCGTPADLLAANLAWSGGRSVIDPAAQVSGTVERSVVLAGAAVGPSEVLTEAIRGDGWTVLSR